MRIDFFFDGGCVVAFGEILTGNELTVAAFLNHKIAAVFWTDFAGWHNRKLYAFDIFFGIYNGFMEIRIKAFENFYLMLLGRIDRIKLIFLRHHKLKINDLFDILYEKIRYDDPE